MNTSTSMHRPLLIASLCAAALLTLLHAPQAVSAQDVGVGGGNQADDEDDESPAESTLYANAKFVRNAAEIEALPDDTEAVRCPTLTTADLPALARLTGLKGLFLGVNGLSSAWLTDGNLKTISSLTTLEELDLTFQVKVTDAGIQHLATMPGLKTLNLSCLEHLTSASIKALVGRGTLESLNLTQCLRLDKAATEHLAKLKTLKVLKVHNALHSPGALLPLGKSKSIEALAIEHVGGAVPIINDELVQELSRIKTLTSLTLCGGNYHTPAVTDKGLKALAKMKGLQELKLTGATEITDKGVQEFAKSETLRAFTMVGLSSKISKQVTASGLATLLKTCPALKVLHLSGQTHLGEDFMAVLQEHGGSLKSLDLSGLLVTDESLQLLAPALESLEALYLNGCKSITDAGLEHLKTMAELKLLYLYSCTGVTREGVAELRKSRPVTVAHQ